MTKRIKAIVGPLALAGFFGGATVSVLARPLTAAPFFERMSATVCQPTNPLGGSHSYFSDPNGYSSVRGTGTTGNYFTCPVPEKTDMYPGYLSQIEVYVNDVNGNSSGSQSARNVRVMACSTNNSGIGGCGTATYSTDTIGRQPISLTGSKLAELDHYGQSYLYVSVPAPYNGAYSSLLGLYFNQP